MDPNNVLLMSLSVFHHLNSQLTHDSNSQLMLATAHSLLSFPHVTLAQTSQKAPFLTMSPTVVVAIA
jgi:hypothetical protein